jgi:hypothetical protein
MALSTVVKLTQLAAFRKPPTELAVRIDRRRDGDGHSDTIFVIFAVVKAHVSRLPSVPAQRVTLAALPRRRDLRRLQFEQRDNPCMTQAPTHAFSQRPLPPAYRPFIKPIWKVRSGSKCRVPRRASEWHLVAQMSRSAYVRNLAHQYRL